MFAIAIGIYVFFYGLSAVVVGGRAEYISVVWVTAAMGSALTAGHFGKAPK